MHSSPGRVELARHLIGSDEGDVYMRTKKSRVVQNRILIVDDHPLVRTGLAKVINQQKDMVVCGEADSAPECLEFLAGCCPDAIIIDISLREGNGLDLIKDIRAIQPELPVLVLSMHHENLYAERAFYAGANGYVMKREAVTMVLEALRKIIDGKIAVSDNIVSRLFSPRGRSRCRAEIGRSPADLLSDREFEVFLLLGEGYNTRRIAARLHVAASTIESYRAAIKQKLGLADGNALVAAAARFLAKDMN